MQEEIRKHENIITNLTNQLNNELNLNDKLIINEKIKSEQEFIISLYKIQNGNTKIPKKENNNSNIQDNINNKRFEEKTLKHNNKNKMKKNLSEEKKSSK